MKVSIEKPENKTKIILTDNSGFQSCVIQVSWGTIWELKL